MDLAAVATGPFSPTDVHARLARMAGRWTGTAKTYADPSNREAAEVAPWDGTIEMLLGGRFLRFAYVSRAMGEPIAGELTLAYEKGDRLFRMSWIDSLHTGGAILVSESKPVPEGGAVATISALGTFFVGEGQPRWGWRTELDDQTDGALRVRMFNIKPDGDESIGVEIDLTREDRR
ncbi:MAG: hypothetical protein QOI41_338 [Myxococcales bacterium]|jgi:hypothetical protein|nr:hypothetical protein [Myxococcales bacterium]